MAGGHQEQTQLQTSGDVAGSINIGNLIHELMGTVNQAISAAQWTHSALNVCEKVRPIAAAPEETGSVAET